MPALVAGIHVIGSREIATWMAGSSPAMTALVSWLREMRISTACDAL